MSATQTMQMDPGFGFGADAVTRKAKELIAFATDIGLNVTITRESAMPPAMGNVAYVVDVWPLRSMAEPMNRKDKSGGEA